MPTPESDRALLEPLAAAQQEGNPLRTSARRRPIVRITAADGAPSPNASGIAADTRRAVLGCGWRFAAIDGCRSGA
jgi:hypothetical protein